MKRIDPETVRRLAPYYVGRQCQERDTFASVYICGLECAATYMQGRVSGPADDKCAVCRKPEP